MFDRIRRHWLLGILVIALLINVAIYWPKNRATAGDRFPAPPEAQPLAEADHSTEAEARRAQFQAALDKLPADQKKAIEERQEADQAFFASIQNLPEPERRQKMEEHFQQNPPPPMPLAGGPPPGPPPSEGPGAHIPPPEVRRSMDQHIADAQRSESQQP